MVSDVGYATAVMRLRDADSETEIALEAFLEGECEDEAVLELEFVQPYTKHASQQTRGYVRLKREHFDALAEWIGKHAEDLCANWRESDDKP